MYKIISTGPSSLHCGPQTEVFFELDIREILHMDLNKGMHYLGEPK
ncbi:unnamed protein product [Acanthoscelides obtectus]|uniref:Uncharacterized protein n=1 Tax=Acanthoscelides obtectus TaxID=200917 RepID=A0A9P0PGZ7_ACAOB|nr:unnamed protein product [Acanthoscelides obtectus]CAK1681859.1 hypothetical protein AOBTE_LOCUS33315 [Acanthoscelides obtectus]